MMLSSDDDEDAWVLDQVTQLQGWTRKSGSAAGGIWLKGS